MAKKKKKPSRTRTHQQGRDVEPARRILKKESRAAKVHNQPMKKPHRRVPFTQVGPTLRMLQSSAASTSPNKSVTDLSHARMDLQAQARTWLQAALNNRLNSEKKKKESESGVDLKQRCKFSVDPITAESSHLENKKIIEITPFPQPVDYSPGCSSFILTVKKNVIVQKCLKHNKRYTSASAQTDLKMHFGS